jgi:hypothetical protein
MSVIGLLDVSKYIFILESSSQYIVNRIWSFVMSIMSKIFSSNI